VADRLDVAVVGAGPFGLSVAAHLTHRRVRAFGRPMETWRTRMPPDMRLRSDWSETNLSAPQDRGTIAGQPVPCLPLRLQLAIHQGYPVRPSDRHDVALLEELLMKRREAR